MTRKPLKDVAASVRQRLLNRSRERDEDFQLTLIYYGLERLMCRLSRSILPRSIRAQRGHAVLRVERNAASCHT